MICIANYPGSPRPPKLSGSMHNSAVASLSPEQIQCFRAYCYEYDMYYWALVPAFTLKKYQAHHMRKLDIYVYSL